MNRRQRLDRLEVAATRQYVKRFVPAGETVDTLLAFGIRFLDRPLDELARDWPQFSHDQLREIQSYLPGYRRALMAGR